MVRRRDLLLRRYYTWVAGLLILVAAGDIGIIAYRRFWPAPMALRPPAVAGPGFQIDPNTATVEDLESVPGMKRGPAQAIVAYRAEFKTRFPERTAFLNVRDLKKARGVTDKVVLRLSPFLIFPGQRPSSQPGNF